MYLVLSSNLHAQTIQGKITSVTDGDTAKIRATDGKEYKIRFYGIDTPEKAQYFGQKAKKFTASLIAGQQVSVKIYDTDRYGRAVGVIKVGSKNVNREIIRNGYAWVYNQYCKKPFCDEWNLLEKQAKRSRRGLWADSSPTPPWDWRKNKRNASKPSYNKPTPPKASQGTGPYHGNTKSKVYHSSDCRWYNCKNCTIIFRSTSAAEHAGYKRCKQE